MKKLMMMAVMFVASATAFAGDSDALKAILKAKTVSLLTLRRRLRLTTSLLIWLWSSSTLRARFRPRIR